MSDTTPGGYRPGLDGLRALAVAAVLLFHLDRLPGGNLGVDAFFVVSGWLITWRLLNEADGRGGIDVGSFWNARIRRLLPASLMVLATVAVVWPLVGIDVASLRRDLLWAGGWASNWGTITGGGDYWARFSEPSPVTHFWSLAIEEQFYLVWPLVLFAVVRYTRHNRAMVGLLAGTAAVGSIVLMNLMFDPADPTATYVNTFARAHSLLIGATAAAFTVVLGDGRLRGGRLARTLAPIGALVAVTLMVVSSQGSTWLFSWGFPVFAVAMAAVVVAVADGAGCRVLASRPMRWVGDRSYGIYLWHWPVFLLLTPTRLAVPDSVMATAAVDALRVVVAVVLADVSFRFVESPIRAVRPRLRWRTPAVAAVALAVMAMLALTVVPAPVATSDAASVVRLPPVAPSEGRASVPGTDARPDVPVDDAGSVPPPPAAESVVAAPVVPNGGDGGDGAVGAPAETPVAARPLRVLVAGDSTALHLSQALVAYAATVPEQLLVGSAAFPGCGLSAGSDGRLHEFTNPRGDRELIDLSGCLVQWEGIPQRIADEAIDVVLVSIGPWDVVDVHVGDDVVAVDDPVGQLLVDEAYRSFVDRVTAAGADVVWITPADTHLGWGTTDDPVNDPDRWTAVRAILAGLGVAQVDLPGWLSAGGIDGPAGRPDGVHLTDELNARFVEEQVAPALRSLAVDVPAL